MRCFLTTIGTSILENNLKQEDRLYLRGMTNKKKSELNPDETFWLESFRQTFFNSIIPSLNTHQLLRQKSAELNAILRYYSDNAPSERDQHFLICTDTATGELSATLIKTLLEKQEILSEVIPIPGLSTKDGITFKNGIKNLLSWYYRTINGFVDAKYQIIFNLTGGFKSLHGVMTVLGTISGAKIISVFETSDHLLTIPIMPIQINHDLFNKNAPTFFCLENGLPVTENELIPIPDSLYDEDGTFKMLSVWGELMWKKAKISILSSRIIEIPGIKYHHTLQSDFQTLTQPSLRIRFQEKLSEIAVAINSDPVKGYNDLHAHKSIQLELLKCTRAFKNPLDHFRINDSYRASCFFKNGTVTIVRVGKHDEINDNPGPDIC